MGLIMHIPLYLVCTLGLIFVSMTADGFSAEDLIKQNLSQQKQLTLEDDIANMHTNRMKRSRVCHGSHGCFSWRGHFYHILKRPIMYNPYFETDHMKYALYTQQNRNTPHFLKINDNAKLNESTFNPNRPTKFLTHGWTQLSCVKSPFNTTAPAWMWELKDALLDRDDVNVILVDWTVGSDYHYMKAAPNARLAGADVALMVKYLRVRQYLLNQTGARPEDFHMIGHSLGAQVAGYAGTRLSQMGYILGRITGLDPVKRYFQGMPGSVRLDPSDARFVDVIHTNGGNLAGVGHGVIEPSGHIDFYVNGGRSKPGCGLSSRCSHNRAYELFISSVKNLCSYQARQCYRPQGHVQSSYQCGFRNVSMGYLAGKAQLSPGEDQLNLYLRTEGRKPYCQLPVINSLETEVTFP